MLWSNRLFPSPPISSLVSLPLSPPNFPCSAFKFTESTRCCCKRLGVGQSAGGWVVSQSLHPWRKRHQLSLMGFVSPCPSTLEFWLARSCVGLTYRAIAVVSSRVQQCCLSQHAIWMHIPVPSGPFSSMVPEPWVMSHVGLYIPQSHSLHCDQFWVSVVAIYCKSKLLWWTNLEGVKTRTSRIRCVMLI